MKDCGKENGSDPCSVTTHGGEGPKKKRKTNRTPGIESPRRRAVIIEAKNLKNLKQTEGSVSNGLMGSR